MRRWERLILIRGSAALITAALVLAVPLCVYGAQDIKTQGASIAALNSLNQMVGKLLMHIRTDDRKVAQHVRQS